MLSHMSIVNLTEWRQEKCVNLLNYFLGWNLSVKYLLSVFLNLEGISCSRVVKPKLYRFCSISIRHGRDWKHRQYWSGKLSYQIFENVTVLVRNNDIKLIQLDIKQYLFEISRNYIVTCSVLNLYSIFVLKMISNQLFCTQKQYKTKYFLIKMVQNWDYIM